MAGAIIQLVAYGVQDLYLTGDPQITFFKIIYRRHTNFSVESVLQNFSAPANFGETVTCTISRVGDLVGEIMLYMSIPAIPKFINPLTYTEDPIKKFAWVRFLGYALIQEITIEIGGKLIDRQYGEWLYIWEQVSGRQDLGIDKMVGNVPSMYEFSNGKDGYELYVPLKFWFCKNSGLALPLIALASSDVKITIMFRRLEECFRIGPTSSIEVEDNVVPFVYGDYIEQTVNGEKIAGYFMGFDYLLKKIYYIKIVDPNAIKKRFESSPISGAANSIPYRIYKTPTNDLNLPRSYCTPKAKSIEMIEQVQLPYKPIFVNSFLYVNYIYLDTDERFKFARSNHEYLIEQIQYNQEIGVNSPNIKQNLTLDHPCKAHYWIAQLDMLVGPGTINDLFNYTTSYLRRSLPVGCQEDAEIVSGGNGELVGTDLVENATLLLNGRDRFGVRDSEYFNLTQPYQHHYRGPEVGINMYSFCLYPEDHQPSATCNMSKIDYITMQMQLNNIINSKTTCRIRSYTINYNVLRIFFNLGGLAFV
jgi:hypothetical protein